MTRVVAILAVALAVLPAAVAKSLLQLAADAAVRPVVVVAVQRLAVAVKSPLAILVHQAADVKLVDC